MGQYDYGEIVCTAIDEIVTARLQGIQCDITKMCNIVDDSYSHEGKYIVSDGGARFEAFSFDTNFKNGNSVLVTIPNGDFNLQKNIVGRIAAADSTPFKYISPLSTMLKIENDLFNNQEQVETGLLINKNNTGTAKRHLNIELEKNNKYEGFTRLGVSADFKCLLNRQNTVSGAYGLKILIYTEEYSSPDAIEKTSGVVELTFDSTEMVGNPYLFDNYFTQEKVFDISTISNIIGIDIYLYQNGKFKNQIGGELEDTPWSYTEIDLSTKEETQRLLQNNLFVNNIKLYFGYELSKYSGETLELYCADDTTYHYTKVENNGNEKTINLRWIHQNSDLSISLLDENKILEEEYKDYEIHWFKHNYNLTDVNKYAGPHWEEITPKINDQLNLKSLQNIFNPDIKKQTEQIKAVGLISSLVDFNVPINDFIEIFTDIFYEQDNNKKYNLKITNSTKEEENNQIFKYEVYNGDKFYPLIIEEDNNNYLYYYTTNGNDKNRLLLNTLYNFPIWLNKYNVKVEEEKNHYLLCLMEDGKIYFIKNKNIENKYELKWKEYLNSNDRTITKQYYYLDENGQEINLLLVENKLNKKINSILQTIKLSDFEDSSDYNKAIMNVYIDYSEAEPEPEYVITSHQSNIILLENGEKVIDDLTYSAASALSIRCQDNSEGNYFIYDQNGKIINSGSGNGDIKYFEVQYKGQPLNNHPEIQFGEHDYIKWYLPFDNDNNNSGINIQNLHNTHTMLVKNPSLWGYKDGLYKNKVNNQYLDVIFTDGVDYIGIERKTILNKETGKYELEPLQPYMIKNYWTQQDANNIIRCEVNISGILYKATEDLKFGKAGSNGTNTTLVLDILNGQNALITNSNFSNEKNEIQIQAILYDINGNIIDLPKNENNTKDITWSWYSKSESDYIQIKDLDENNQISGNQIITLICNTTAVPEDNYFILKAECGNNPKLEAFLPIPIKTNKTSKIEGAREVLYDYQGIPSYYSQAYILFDEKYLEIFDSRTEWKINSNETYKYYDYKEDKQQYIENEDGEFILLFIPLDENDIYQPNIYYTASNNQNIYTISVDSEIDTNKIYYKCINQQMAYDYSPKLNFITRGSKDDYLALKAASFFAKGPQSKVCVSCNYGDYGWSQPILIMENHYNFDVLNQWDNSLTLDENNGTILSTMLGAGRKNKQNQFSGVLIGDIKGGTGFNDADEYTGVYGLHNGELSYALRDDGTATFGKAGHGQIKIDGNSGRIYSPNYYNSNNNSGMLIDLDDGLLSIKNRGQQKIYISPNSNQYLAIYDDNEKNLIKISDGEYYLRSANYSIRNNSGSNFNLSNGNLNINGNGGNLNILDNQHLFHLQMNKNNTISTLIDISEDDYYLQSSQYHPTKQVTINQDNKIYELYKNEKTIIKNGDIEKFNVSNIIAYLDKGSNNNSNSDENDYDLFQVFENNNNYIIGDKIIFQRTTIDRKEEYKDDQDENVIYQTTYSADEYKDWFLQFLTPLMEIDSIKPSGMKIDLENGKINGYDLYLRGINSKNDKQSFTLDSGASVYPFKIGEKFKVKWDGTLYCDNIKYLGTKPPAGDTIVNINDHFTVTKGGGVGASSVSAGMGNFGGGWFGGTANIAKSIEGLDLVGLKRINKFKVLTSFGVETSSSGSVTLAWGIKEIDFLGLEGESSVKYANLNIPPE